MKLLVLDGNSIINRAFYGVRLLSAKDGTFTNAVFGFLNILSKLQEQVSPDGIVAAFDLKEPTFRHKLYDGYKAGRKPMPDELAAQLPLVKEILTLLGCTVLEQPGYEADDILGTLAASCEAQGHECFIATGDRDSLQLVSDRVTVLLASTKMGQAETVVYDPAAIFEKYGLAPAALIDLKALMGDQSDKIPGVPGVGEKTAVSLLQQFGSLDALYEQLDGADVRDTLKTKLKDGFESAQLSRTLGTICKTVPLATTTVSDYVQRPMKRDELARLLARLELFKFIKRLGLDEAAPAPETTAAPAAAVKISGDERLSDVIALAKAEKSLDIVIENGGLLVCLPNEVVKVSNLTDLLPVLPAATVRTNDSKALYRLLLDNGVKEDDLTLVAVDTRLCGYLLNPLSSDYSVVRLAQEYGLPLADGEDEAVKAAATFSAVADALPALVADNGQEYLLKEVELPLALVLAKMEHRGFAVDGEGIAAFGERLDDDIEAYRKEVCAAVGYEFNLNSPKQLGKAFFEDMEMPHGKKTKSGYSTNADVLEKLRPLYPVVDDLLNYRSLSKLKSTYCDGLLKVITPDGRVHTSFNQTETRTGRISSLEPNLQNIPVRSELGRELRRFFKAADGCVLCDADYSQIELRVLAAMANEPTMTAAFVSGADIHRTTAAQVFGVPEDEVTPLWRTRAKAVNFGIVYGIGAHSLAEDLSISYGEAKKYIDAYFEKYSAITAFMNGLVESAREKGYGETLFGRRRPLPELASSNHMLRAFGERAARNMPIQGTAADIIKIAMIRVENRLKAEGLAAKLILQVHDELIVEAPQAEAEQVKQLLAEEMEKAVSLSVPMAVDAHVGETWFDAKG
ncbi:MAG: DNA polymerase I [Clostridia bacterium]|nr:DNA polymerase I [Clostridia bacterium]